MDLLLLVATMDNMIIAVCLLLILMSCVSWTLFLTKLFGFARQYLAWRHSHNIWQAQWLAQLAAMAESDSPRTKSLRRFGLFGQLAMTGQRCLASYRLLAATSALSADKYLASQLMLKVNAQCKRQARGLGLLASIAATSPFIGLFGTTWGIYLTLAALSAKQQLSLQLLAAPIGEALLVTALGLAVAVPALLFYNLLNSKSDSLRHRLAQFSQHWHNYLLTGLAHKGGQDGL